MIVRRNPLFDAHLATSRIETIAQRLSGAQTRAVTGIRIRDPSDAPGQWGALHGLNAAISDQRVWQEGADRAQSLLDVADSTLESASGAVQRGLERAIQLSSESYSTEERTAAVAEIASIRSELVTLGNTRLGERSVFAGDTYDGAAFDPAGTYVGGTASSAIRIGEDNEVVVALDGGEVFGDVFAQLDALEAALAADDPAAVAATIDGLDLAHRHLVAMREDVGYRQLTVDDARVVSEGLESLLGARLSESVAADPVAAYAELQALQTSYQAALQITASGSGSMLFDYLG